MLADGRREPVVFHLNFVMINKTSLTFHPKDPHISIPLGLKRYTIFIY